ncbi:uncharacterized protein C8Q71DRAFT_854468 [Rhodofomes roseus]|uniref:DUF6533 domain-containing protein n=1 Tax=Rhodofomes roseus TaxID=34475 RepID=A0ABQ8KQG5_9APHY|nr:uncharacterized protein C8Q71DRAFT_854468 [Rhodofomes roseus]KAH9840584.1 hypothetical protein C8Q71DRAFT_854468 [Rhodofomes roseus]
MASDCRSPRMILRRDYNQQDVVAIAATDDTLYVCAAYGALVMYNYITTFPREVELYWMPCKLSGPAVIFFTNRYALVLYAVASVLNLPAWSTPLRHVSPYTMNLKNKTAACVALVLGLTPFVINIQSYSYIGEDGLCMRTRYYSTTTGTICKAIAPSLNSEVSYAAWAGVVLADLLVVAVTWARTYAFVRWARRAKIASPLVTLYLRDGTLYFLAILLVNTVELCINQSWVHASTSTSTSSSTPSSSTLSGSSVNARDDWYTIVPLAPMLVSRFLLHLRQVSSLEPGADPEPEHDSWPWAGKDRADGPGGAAGSATFSLRLVGNMGAELEFASLRDSDEVGEGDEEEPDLTWTGSYLDPKGCTRV